MKTCQCDEKWEDTRRGRGHFRLPAMRKAISHFHNFRTEFLGLCKCGACFRRLKEFAKTLAHRQNWPMQTRLTHLIFFICRAEEGDQN